MKNNKLDLMDGILYYSKSGNDPVQFSDYPERVLNALRIFHRETKIPTVIIPSKKTKSKFQEWVNELDELIAICPTSEKFEKAIKRVMIKKDVEKMRFTIARPASIKNILVDVVAEMAREEEKNVNSNPNVQLVNVATEKKKLQVAKDMRNMFNEEE